MSQIANTRGPLGLKPPKDKTRTSLRRVATGKKSSSDCPIMKAAKGQPCLADWCGCNGSTETTAMRHIRKFNIAGMGQKPPNYIAFFGCQVAEDMFEKQRTGWEWSGVMQAMVLTQMKLRAMGLLPV
ncbi:MAG: nuclease domain-containing protein [Pseudomonadota bacterium]